MPEVKEEEEESTRKEVSKEFSIAETCDKCSMVGDTNGNNHKYILKGGIKFNNFSAEYGKSFRALNELNFSIQPGEKVCVVGRTGSGKSTLLLSILDLLYHTSGVRKS